MKPLGRITRSLEKTFGGSEAPTLYDSMRAGRAGSSILGTMHEDSANTVFDRVVHTMGLQPEEF
jgi:type IV secretory pathway ATPase VirB11/archaellum biosynthesis ATPase